MTDKEIKEILKKLIEKQILDSEQAIKLLLRILKVLYGIEKETEE